MLPVGLWAIRHVKPTMLSWKHEVKGQLWVQQLKTWENQNSLDRTQWRRFSHVLIKSKRMIVLASKNQTRH